MSEIPVWIYLKPHIKKWLKRYSGDMDIFMGEAVTEALLWWMKEGKQKAIEEMKVRNEVAEVERLKSELDELQDEIDRMYLTRAERKMLRLQPRRKKK